MPQVKQIESFEDWHEMLEASESKPVLLMKHSTRCPVSANAWNEFHKFLKTPEHEKVHAAFVKVIESRPASMQIAEDTGVPHESPQAILLINRKAVWSATHYDITANALQQSIQQ